MAVPLPIKIYIAKNYGDGRKILPDTGRRLGAACMIEESSPGAGLARPLPEGYGVDDICNEEVLTWAYENVGWEIPEAEEEEKGYLTVTSDPSGANVYVDGTYIGTTPIYLYEISPGKHTVRVSKPGYEDYTTTVTITAGQRLAVSATLKSTTPETGKAGEPPDAIKEYIVKNYGDGRCILSDTGRRLGAACMLEESTPGTGLARPLPEGYGVDDICSESTITWAYDNVGWCLSAEPSPAPSPEPSPAPGETTLCIRAIDKSTGEEINAWIFIDELFTGKSTPECLPVSAGTRTVKLYHPLYRTVEQSVSVVSGTTNEVTIEMEKIPYGEPIEIMVVAPCADDELVRPVLEPPYSDIPTMIMKGTLARFRIFFVNNGMAAPLDESKTYIYIEKPDTGERYYFNMIEADIGKTIDARGESIRFEGTVPLTASTGAYNMYLEWDVKVPPEQRCKF